MEIAVLIFFLAILGGALLLFLAVLIFALKRKKK